MKIVIAFLVIGLTIVGGSVYFEFIRGIVFGGALIALTILSKGMQIAYARQVLPAGYMIKSLWAMGCIWFILLTVSFFTSAPEFLSARNEWIFYLPVLVLYFFTTPACLLFVKYMDFLERNGIEINHYFNKHPFKSAAPMVFFGISTLSLVVAIMAYSHVVSDLPTSEQRWSLLWPYILGVVLPIIVLIIFYNVPITLAKITENKTLRNWARLGRGGSARWAGPASFEKLNFLMGSITRQLNGMRSEFGDGRIFLGKTLQLDAAWPNYIGIKDDAHMVTIGMTGAGKSTSVLFNNLPLWTGGAFILDPKGELAQYSYRQRGKHTRKAIVLDPFNQTGEQNGIIRSRFNPLSEIDVNSQAVGMALSNISEGCIVDDGDRNRHWTELGKTVIEGLIAHFLTTRPANQHNLPAIADAFLSLGDPEIEGAKVATKFKDLLVDMSANPACGGIVQQASSSILNSGNEGYGAIISTVQRGLKWATDPAMRDHLSESDFSLSELAEGSTTVYVVLPFDLIDISKQARWMRVLTTLAIASVQNARSKPEPSVLFVMDEFYSLGHFPKIEDSVVQMRGAGIKLWLFLQNLGQLQQLYAKNWETFTGNSNTQIIGIGNDNATTNWVSERIGDFIDNDKKNRRLITAAEVSSFLGKEARKQIVLPVDGPPMRLQSIFFEDFIPEGFRDSVSNTRPVPEQVSEKPPIVQPRPQPVLTTPAESVVQTVAAESVVQTVATEPTTRVVMREDDDDRGYTEAIESALRRFRMETPFTQLELDEMLSFWLLEKPKSLREQTRADYETLLPLAA
ncbi:MAG: hypothetical protein COA43_16575 [Robiginitomaculum sp.]|nr:MAG: hypothetical protein COA43_16575 [Robiginitomaculum sp.]